MVFRPYHPADRDPCLHLLHLCTPPFFAPCEEADFVAFLADPANYFVGCQDGTVIACGGVDRLGDLATLRWTIVTPARHGRGLGRQLVEHLLAVARQTGAARVQLETTQHGRGFFERMGFGSEKTTLDGFAPGLHRIAMGRELTAEPS